MQDIILLTNDNYYRLGFESLIRKIHSSGKTDLVIMDDGVQFLYFLSMKERDKILPVTTVSAEYFITLLKMTIPRNTTPDHLKFVIHAFRSGRYHRRRLTPAAYRVLLDIASGVPCNISRVKLQLKHKPWYNLKGNAFVKLGIKNTVVFMRAIHVWHNVCHQVMPAPMHFHQD
jgi:DNA-binding CsgD family transcriptional regulator